MSSIFSATLVKAGLDHYLDNFMAFGIDSLQSLTLLTMQDYGVVGVSSMEDRKRERVCLFQLIQHLKNETDLANPSPLHIQLIPQQRDMKPGMSFLPKPASSSVLAAGAGVAFGKSASSASTSNMASTLSAPPQDDAPLVRSLPRSNRAPSPERNDRSAPQLNQQQNSKAFDLNALDSDDSDEPVTVKYSFSPSRSNKGPQPLLNAYGVPTSIAAAQRVTVGGGAGSGNSRVDLSDRIRVCVRKRPLNKKELRTNQIDVATVSDRRTLIVNEPKVKVDLTKYVEQHEFTFDEVFDCDCTNDDVYRRSAFPLVEYIFTGGKATCFAYGQTGSGKTYTMLDEANGLYVMAGRDIFKLLEKPEYQHLAAYVGFYEIYQSQLYDLLNARKRLHAREDGKNNVVISGLNEYEVNSVQKVMDIFNHGHNARSTGATGANADSSRSHAIFQIVLKHKKNKKKVQGKLSFIDLAGSERGADRGDSDQKTRMEGSEINKSLLALKECIRALDQDSKHTPFRQSKLTQVLKDSFIGNSRTCMIATVSPNSANSEHSLNTLRYAYRVKELKGDVQPQDSIREDPKILSDGIYDEPDSGDDDPLLIDSEFPPENLLDSDDGVSADDTENSPDEAPIVPQVATKQQRTSVLSQLNNNRAAALAAASGQNGVLKRESVADIRSVRAGVSDTGAALASRFRPTRGASDGGASQTSAGVNSNTSSPAINDSGSLDELVNVHRQHLRLFAELSKAESKLIVNYSMKLKPDPSMSNEAYLKELEGIMMQKERSIRELQRQIEKCKTGK
ncbi:Kinesin-like protein kif24 [Chytriomyces hyalinus]|nr:Kinesin-like protein kif24 [Chytriomyces hyalinus]